MKISAVNGQQHQRIRIQWIAVAATIALIFLTGRVRAQNGQSEKQPTLHVQVDANDQVAASMTSAYRVHILPVNTTRSHRYSPLQNVSGAPPVSPSTPNFEQAAPESLVSTTTVPSLPAPGFYPSDLTNPSHGKIVTSAQSNPVYVDCAATCWGTPATFLTNLGNSTFIHVADQYVGLTTNGRYTAGTAASVTYPVFTALSDNDMLQIVHSAAKLLGTGYGHIYHVFLPSGVDVCFAGTSSCYSPNNPATFAFCAYHSSVTFSDIGHVLFTVEPYQAVSGCEVTQPSPNGALIDSTSNVLSHETFEAITDPDPSTGWIAQGSLPVDGAEIGDLCETPTFGYGTFAIGTKTYEVQPEYSNKYHGCANVP